MSKWLILVCLLVSGEAYALRLANGQLLSTGDDIAKVYEHLGKPVAKYRAKVPCGARQTCSATRMVYRFDGRKWYIDTRHGEVVNIQWTYR